MNIADIDTEYYKTVWETQNDPEILKSELKDLINDCLRAKEDTGAKLACSAGLSGLEIHIILDEKDPSNPIFVEIENKLGESIGIGTREIMPDGLTRLIITINDMIEKA
jgi:hypothetical protein